MKIIDLLNIIANGEKIPKKIIYNHEKYEYDKDNNDYKSLCGDYLFENLFEGEIAFLNEKIEVVENEMDINLLKGDQILINDKWYDVIFENDFEEACCFSDKEIKWFDKNDIQKVERPEFEPDYVIIYEKKETPKEVLTDKEKEYLRAVIKPYRNKISSIAKHEFDDLAEQYIFIKIAGGRMFYLPEFEKNTMYKGMEVGKEYTLEELGL